jgi:replicative DNA helicase
MSETLPHSPRAEQHLLGILLHDYVAVERVPPKFKAEHMFDPVHQRLCAEILLNISRGGTADLTVLGERFAGDEGFEQLGGFGYLADLVDQAPPATSTADLCHLISDKAHRRELIRIGEEMIRRAHEEQETPALDMIDEVEQELYSLTTSREEKGPRAMGDMMGEAIEMIADAIDRGDEMAGMSTGLMDLDKKLGGLPKGDLVVLAARPSMGKTSLAMEFALHNSKSFKQVLLDGAMVTTKGGVVAFFSLEMSGGQLGIRILAQEIETNGDRLKRGQVSVDEFRRLRDAAEEILDAPLYTDDTAAISLSAIVTRSRRLKRLIGLDLVIVDLAQLVTVGGSPGMSPNERISKITQGLKAMAKELDVCVVLLSHVTRQVENRPDKRPQLSDLKESGSLEQDADIVMFLYREAYYLEREQPKEGSAEHLKWEEDLEKCRNEAEVIIAKQRHGPIGTVKLRFNSDTTKFRDTIKDEEFQPRAA